MSQHSGGREGDGLGSRQGEAALIAAQRTGPGRGTRTDTQLLQMWGSEEAPTVTYYLLHILSIACLPVKKGCHL